MKWITLACPLMIAALSAHGESGTVVDEATRQPLEGVVVVASFRGSVLNPLTPHSTCYHLDVAVSDSRGEFNVDRLSGDLKPWVTDRRRGLQFFKAGYRISPAWKADTNPVLLRRFEGSVDERFETELRLPMPGSDCDGYFEKQLPLARAMHQEASTIATSYEQRLRASMLQFELERRTLGDTVAKKHWDSRLGELKKSHKER